MNRIWRTIAVNARMDDVYGFLANPHNLAEVWPNLDEVRHVERSKVNGAYDFDAEFHVARRKLKTKAQSVDAQQYDHMKLRTEKDLESTIDWKLAPIGGRSTKVTLRFDYQTPKQAAEDEGAHALVKETERGVDAMLKNLKSRVETERSYAKA